MRYLSLCATFLFVSWATIVHAAKAVVVVGAPQSDINGISVEVSVSNDQVTSSFSTTFVVNFANSTNQINADIKQRVRELLAERGIILSVNDIILFGGSQ